MKPNGFIEYNKIINKKHYNVVLSIKSTPNRIKPHFFRSKLTADKKVKFYKGIGINAKAVPYRKSYVVYFSVN